MISNDSKDLGEIISLEMKWRGVFDQHDKSLEEVCVKNSLGL